MFISRTDSGPPTKRRRKGAESSSEPGISRHQSLYFDNGNIVLLSLPKDNLVTAFKVYKDFLLLYSPVFAGMLSLPPHPDIEKYDDVPLVRLPDETADLIPFLSAIYNPMDIPSRSDFFVAHDKVDSVFKLSKKYQCDTLYKCMKDKLLEIWPLDLKTWDRFAESRGSRRSEEDNSWDSDEEDNDTDSSNGMDNITNNNAGNADSANPEEHEPNPASVLPDPCSAIRLARAYDIPEILPAAFYNLLCTLPDAFMGTMPKDGDHWGLSNSPFGAQANLALLSPRDIICLIRGSYAIRDFFNDLETSITTYLDEYPRNEDECDPDQCYDILQSLMQDHAKDAILYGDALEVLHNADTLDWLDDQPVCGDCLDRYKDFTWEAKRDFWTCLPGFFGL